MSISALGTFARVAACWTALCLPITAAWAVTSATVTTAYSFSSALGSGPQATLIVGSDGNFYGTTTAGGAHGTGTVFKMTAAGALTSLHSFSALDSNNNNPDGAKPVAALMQASDGNFYGTTSAGGANGSGTIFKITPTGTFATLYTFSAIVSFRNSDGASPIAALIQASDGTIYGTALVGGSGGDGTLFKVTPAGILTTLHQFVFEEGGLPSSITQGFDGALYGGTLLYGSGDGTIFKYTSADGQLTTLHSFAGGGPYGRLFQGRDGSFYGVTHPDDGSNGFAFKVTPAGAFAVLHTFTGGADGGSHYSGLVQATDGNFYGTADTGGAGSGGTIYQLNSSGTLNTLYSFGLVANDGFNPQSGLVQGPDGNLYGTTYYGGSSSAGSFFRAALSPKPPAAIVTSQLNVTVSKGTTSNTPAANGEGPAGTYSFTAQFCNKQAIPLSALSSKTTAMSNGNNLVNRTIGSTVAAQPGGAGSILSFPHVGSYATGALQNGQCISVPYVVGLKNKNSFTFTVDVTGNSN